MIQLRTFGAIGLRSSDGEELRALIAQPKRVALLAYLALAHRDRWRRRDRLTALFWPELDAEHARNSLNQALFFLRRHLGAEAILTRNAEDVTVSTDALWCDAVAFEEALAAKRFSEAVELYHGELLAGFHVPDAAAELERWIDGERRRLAEGYADALRRLAEECERSADLNAAIIWWRRLATHEPHDGRVALGLMRALVASGDRAGALAHARIHTLLLEEELEIEPDPEITAFAERLRLGPAPRHHPASSETPIAGSVTAHVAPAVAPLGIASERKSGFLARHRRTSIASGLALTMLILIGFYRTRLVHADPAIRNIAVLPFENLTNDPSKEYLGDIMTDALITELSRYPQFGVRSRASVLHYKGMKPSAAEIASTMGVDGFVEGTLSGDGRTIQVTAQLIQAPNDRHLWGERYVRDSANILGIMNDIAAAIGREVNLRATPAERSRGQHAINTAAYGLYLRGQSEMLSRTPRAMEHARTYFHQAIAIDSTFAPAYAGLSEAFVICGVDGFIALGVARDSALRFANRAVALDSGLAAAHTALGGVYGDAARWGDAEQEFIRAIHLGPSDALAYHWYAQLLLIEGRLHEAYDQVHKGRAVDPTSSSLARTAGPIETALGISRPTSKRAVDAVLRDPYHAWSRATYANRLAEEKKCAEARANIDTARAMIPDNIRMESSVFVVNWYCSDRATAMKVFEQLKHRPEARAHGLWIATLYKRWGQTDSAFAWLDSVEWNGDLRFNFRAMPVWNASKNDPRYAIVLKRMGL